MSWQLPGSPDARQYLDVINDISLTLDPKLARAKFRALAEADFYAFCKWAATFGKHQIKDPGHPHLIRDGKPGFWVDEPYVFDLCRRIQEALDSWKDVDAIFEPREHFKTEIRTKLATIWLTLKDPSMTTAILMHKVDQVGEAVFKGLLEELEKNQVLLDHWPDILRPEKKEYPLWTNTAATIIRKPGPKEPSFSIHSLGQQPTSGHYRHIVVDDAVTQQVVESLRMIKETEEDLKRAVNLGTDDTRWAHVGTIWDANDSNCRLAKQGFFGDSWRPGDCYQADGVTPRLKSVRFLRAWERKEGPYIFSCQMRNKPIAKDNQGLLLQWIDVRYGKKPREVWPDTVPHGFFDYSSGLADDFMVISVIGLGRDRLRYHLDLIREKAAAAGQGALDIIFAAVAYWKLHTLWVEDDLVKKNLEAEMERRTYRFRVRLFPKQAAATPKETRISGGGVGGLVPALARGEHLFPRDGFGHGSQGDTRDTFEQFLEEEYKYWTPAKGLAHNDDCLDAMAWPEQESVRKLLTYPQDVTEDQPTPDDLYAAAMEQARAKQGRGTSGPSWQAA